MEGFVIHPAKPIGKQRRIAWETATRYGVKVRNFYTNRAQAESDAKAAQELCGIRFEVIEAITAC